MGVFSPQERETFERIAAAFEDCAESLKKIANPPRVVPSIDQQEAAYQLQQAINHLSVAAKHLEGK